MIRHHHKPLFSAAAGLALLSIAGCAAESADETPAADAANTPSPAASAPAPGSAEASESAAASGSTAAGPAQAGAYVNGEYTGSGTYIPPSGKEEEVDVRLTLEDSVVTELEVTTSGNHPTSKQYQREFTSDIQNQVVGRNIDELDVSKVLGSSLTSQGFNRALEAIRSEAAG